MATVSQYGRRWDVRVPRGDISWLMGRVHVGAPDAEVEADILRRIGDDPRYDARLRAQSVAYALVCHQRNRDLYAYVTR